MKKSFLIFLFFIFHIYAFDLVRIKELYENAEKFDKKPVIIEGEVIGDIMGKKDEKWINVKEEKGDFAIGVVVSKEDALKIENLGRYGIKGDIIRVKGIYNTSCIKHQGERDIHAIKIEIIKRGGKLPIPEISLSKIISTFILLGITYLIILLYHKKTKSLQ
ncbi:MAG: DNA-binding protein [Candidatus Omnitrophica bacterium]|nr:DNA-binding protein [Candidatus Omnitrophota bacterium]